jgi:hypothetical protein
MDSNRKMKELGMSLPNTPLFSIENFMAPQSGHVSNFCHPIGRVIEPMDGLAFIIIYAESRAVSQPGTSLDTSRTRQGKEDKFRVARDPTGSASQVPGTRFWPAPSESELERHDGFRF